MTGKWLLMVGLEPVLKPESKFVAQTKKKDGWELGKTPAIHLPNRFL